MRHFPSGVKQCYRWSILDARGYRTLAGGGFYSARSFFFLRFAPGVLRGAVYEREDKRRVRRCTRPRQLSLSLSSCKRHSTPKYFGGS